MTTRVLGGAFGAIAKEMAQVIFRTAFFQIIREAEDLGAGLYTAEGQEIAESETTAMHCGSIGAYLRGIRSVWGDDIAPATYSSTTIPASAPRTWPTCASRSRCSTATGCWRGRPTPPTWPTSGRHRRACAPTRLTISPRGATTGR